MRAPTSENFFLVTCAGMSGSKWLAAALDHHPDVVCTHNAAQLRIFDRPYSASEIQEGLDAEGEDRWDGNLEAFFGKTVQSGQASVYGNVHGFRLRTLGPPDDVEEFVKTYRIFNLVRHYVPWVNSCAAQFRHMAETSVRIRWVLTNAYAENERFYEDIAGRFDIDLCDWDNLAFLNGCTILHKLVNEVRDYRFVPHIKMEDVTRDPEKFCQAFRAIVGDVVDIPDGYVEGVFSLGTVNPHSADNRSSAGEIYRAWPAWKKFAFDQKAEECGIVEQYGALGYVF